MVRLDKGHTEGLEPRITETLVRLMVAAPGGNVQHLATTVLNDPTSVRLASLTPAALASFLTAARQ